MTRSRRSGSHATGSSRPGGGSRGRYQSDGLPSGVACDQDGSFYTWPLTAWVPQIGDDGPIVRVVRFNRIESVVRSVSPMCDSAPHEECVPFDLGSLRVPELMALGDQVIAELRRRDLVRTNNKPIGDVAEQIVLAARGGVLEPNSTKSHDVTTDAGLRIQVKAMGARAAGAQAKFSPFRSFDFDVAVFLVFAAETFELLEAWEAPAAAIESGTRYVPHINGRQPGLRFIRTIGADVLPEMRPAYARLDTVMG